ncbi:sugar phosphate isomerase/epimerase family protein [Enterococcus gallinarum]|uniref:AP endonuclease n=1 Tax=Enterococcus gallinarum TaxID=1353 RepID=A0A376GZ32_ENTGA|nr:sugar phosphate isomerase/epimerase [Enterococcus gallinarum]OJG50617.1 AP endonuclease [Enterococcus gallinarum]STD72066.1 AP endonuclease [Enterococcus gallinarum]STD83306.1 AP endonuclease [Enterococcus gallinarum]
MFNLAVRGHDLTKACDPQDLACQVAEKGIKNVQFALNASFPELSAAPLISPGMGTFFKNEFGQQGIQVALLSCYSNLIHPDADKREKILQKFERYLFHARYFGASMVASETGSVIPTLGYSEENFTDEVFDDLVTVAQRLVKTGERYQTMVGIEAGLNHPLFSNDRIQELITRVPSDFLGIVYDPTNLITPETASKQVEIVAEAFEKFGERIVCLHLKDYVIEGDRIVSVPLGEGVIPYQAILQIVDQYKPYCYVVLEGTKDEGIKRAVAMIEGLS